MRILTAACLLALTASACNDATDVPPAPSPPLTVAPPSAAPISAPDSTAGGVGSEPESPEPESPEPKSPEPESPEPDSPEPEADPDASMPDEGVDAGMPGEPAAADGDDDGIPDERDNCVADANPEQIDADDDGIGDACDDCVAQQEVCNGIDDDCNGWIDDGLLNACGECGPLPAETCDGVDNDCDGQTDEGVLNACGACGDVPVEICDGIDNNCDGVIDEGLLNACGTCGPVPTETCNGVDDDCDGQTDEGFGLGLDCMSGRGTCEALGTITCAPDGGVQCDALPGDPIPEVCDGEDNDCDGTIDEGALNACGACGPVPEETCDDIDNDCDGTVDEEARDANACGTCGEAPVEVCDGEDNDCDGSIDEDAIDLNACGRCGPLPAETCDGEDNDCDGEIDEGFAVGQLCARGLGECLRIGRNVCAVDGRGVTCSARAGLARAEQCDGRDNDCDGETDEDARDANACGVCGDLPVETCDGEDNDCDGEIDEGYDVGAACDGGIGNLCHQEGTIACTADGDAECAVDLIDLRRCSERFNTKIAVGRWFSCVIVQGQLKCFGQSPDKAEQFPLGNSPADARARRVPAVDLGMAVEEIAAGGDVICARNDDDGVKCFGSNFNGQWGIGEWRNAVPDWPVANRPTADLRMEVDRMYVSGDNVCARGLNDIKCWGANDDGQLGLGVDETLGDERRDMGEALRWIDVGANVKDLSLGRYSQCALVWGNDLDSAGVKCWGRNYGQIGLDRDEPHVVDLDQMGDALPLLDLGMRVVGLASGQSRHCAVGDAGQVKCWGHTYYNRQPRGGFGEFDGSLAPIPLNMHALRVVSSTHTACAIGTRGELLCWGRDLLDPDRMHGPRRINLNMPVVAVDISADHACALGGNGDVKCWGQNDRGQLGLGDRIDRRPTIGLPAIDLF